MLGSSDNIVDTYASLRSALVLPRMPTRCPCYAALVPNGDLQVGRECGPCKMPQTPGIRMQAREEHTTTICLVTGREGSDDCPETCLRSMGCKVERSTLQGYIA